MVGGGRPTSVPAAARRLRVGHPAFGSKLKAIQFVSHAFGKHALLLD